MNHLISLHSYYLLNAAIALSYLITLSVLKTPLLKKLSQFQQLQFMRRILMTTLFLFFITPFIAKKLSLQSSYIFQFQPLLKQASIHFLQHRISLNAPLLSYQHAFSYYPSMNNLLSLGLFIGVIILSFNYVRTLITLKKITEQAFCKYKIHRISILFSTQTTVPFCWSSLYSHFIILPMALLEKNIDLKLAIRHELQHLRQRDTYWLHLTSLLKIICFWNPFAIWSSNWSTELQEFACDEALIINKKTSRTTYAQCLLNAASQSLTASKLPQAALGIIKQPSILNRRVTMLFTYKKSRKKKALLITLYASCMLTAASIAYAVNSDSSTQSLNQKELKSILNQSQLHLAMTPEVTAELTNIRHNEEARVRVQTALKRMQSYHTYLSAQLKNAAMPAALLALPFVESGYNINATGPAATAGIWQFIPSTAKKFDLVIDGSRDDRMNLQLDTQAALSYLKLLHAQFHDWTLAMIAYEIGETHTEKLIQEVGSRDPWVLARSPQAPQELKKFLAMITASVLIINDPDLIS